MGLVPNLEEHPEDMVEQTMKNPRYIQIASGWTSRTETSQDSDHAHQSVLEDGLAEWRGRLYQTLQTYPRRQGEIVLSYLSLGAGH